MSLTLIFSSGAATATIVNSDFLETTLLFSSLSSNYLHRWVEVISGNVSPVCVPPPAVHTVAHLLNVEWYNNSRQGVYDELSTALSNLADTENTTYLNPIRKTDIVSHQTRF